jgi:hypothetical protein
MNFHFNGRREPLEGVTLRLDEGADLDNADRTTVDGVILYFVKGRIVALGLPRARRQLPLAVFEALQGCGRAGELRAVPYGVNTAPAYDDPPGLEG